MENEPAEQPGDSGEADVGMGADLEWWRTVDIIGSHQVHEAPRSYGAPSLGGQNPEDPELTNSGAAAFFDFDGAHAELGRHAI